MSLQVGIAGAGLMGRAHAEAYARNGVQLFAVADTDPERAEALARTHGARAFARLEDMVAAGANAISICLPHNLHLPAVLYCAERGVPVLIEKPHCTTAAEAWVIRKACREHRQAPMVGFTHRFLRSTIELKRRLGSGEFGLVELVTDCLVAKSLGPSAPAWYGDRAAAGGGIVMMGGIHTVDRLRWLLGSEVTAVHAVCRQADAGEGVEHLAVVLLEFASGACACLAAYRSPAPGHERRHRYQIFGTKASADCGIDEFDRQQLSISAGGATAIIECSGDDPVSAEVGEFLASLREGREPRPGLDDAEIALAIVLAIYESARTGNRVLLTDFMTRYFPWRLEDQ